MRDCSDHGLILCQPDGRIRHDAESVLWSIVHEPDDVDARRQIQLLWADEIHRYRTLGRANFAPSAASAALLQYYRGSASQRFATGMLAIAILLQAVVDEPKKHEAEKSMLRAVRQYMSAKPRMLEQLIFDRGVFQTIDSAPLTNQRSIQKAHAEYRRVAHILAANLIASSFLQPLDPIDCPPDYVHRLIATAASIEVALTAKAAGHYPDLLSVVAHIPVEAQQAKPFPIAGGLWSFLVAGLSEEQIEKFSALFTES